MIRRFKQDRGLDDPVQVLSIDHATTKRAPLDVIFSTEVKNKGGTSIAPDRGANRDEFYVRILNFEDRAQRILSRRRIRLQPARARFLTAPDSLTNFQMH